MAIRGDVTIECDRKACHAEIVLYAAEDAVITATKHGSIELTLTAAGWRVDDEGGVLCPDCLDAEGNRDEAYERAAARARNNDFAETGGKDWT
jgi:hypothetical protein